MTNYAEAFQELNLLDDGEFNINDEEDIKSLSKFVNDDVEDDDTIDVIDLDADEEEDLQTSYLGKVILTCPVCHTEIFKDKDDIEIEEDSEYVNIGEECPICLSDGGFEIVGEVAPYQEGGEEEIDTEVDDKPVDVEEPEDIEEPEDEEETPIIDDEEDEEKNESLKVGKSLKESVSDDAYIVADVILNKLEQSRKGSISYEDFKDLFEQTCDEVLTETPEDEDFETDVRGILSYSGWNTVFEGDNEGGLVAKNESLKESVTNKHSKRKLKEGALGTGATLAGGGARAAIGGAIGGLPGALVGGAIGSGLGMAASAPADAVVDSAKEIASKVDVGDVAGESLKEGFEHVNVETEDSIMDMTQDENGKVTVTTEPKSSVSTSGEEMIAPVGLDTAADILDNNEEPIEEPSETPEFEEPIEEPEFGDEVEQDFDDVDEDSFNTVGESYFKSVYGNVKSFKLNEVKEQNNTLIAEGLITFNNGNTRKTTFKFTPKTIDRQNNVKFIGENLEITPNRKRAYTLTGTLNNGKFITESISYRYGLGRKKIVGKATNNK